MSLSPQGQPPSSTCIHSSISKDVEPIWWCPRTWQRNEWLIASAITTTFVLSFLYVTNRLSIKNDDYRKTASNVKQLKNDQASKLKIKLSKNRNCIKITKYSPYPGSPIGKVLSGITSHIHRKIRRVNSDGEHKRSKSNKSQVLAKAISSPSLNTLERKHPVNKTQKKVRFANPIDATGYMGDTDQSQTFDA